MCIQVSFKFHDSTSFIIVFSNHWEKQYNNNVPDSLRQIFGSSQESKLSKIIGHTIEDSEKRNIRSYSLCSSEVMETKKHDTQVSNLQHRLIQNQRSRAQSTPYFTPLDPNQKRNIQKLALDAISEHHDDLDGQKKPDTFANYKMKS